LLYDGWCNLCSAWVAFVLRWDRRARFRFAALASKAGAEALARCRGVEDPAQTLVLVEGGRCRTRSDAVLRICELLPWPWPALGIGRWVPRAVRDSLYDVVARNRRRWFGQPATCRTSMAGYGERFLE